MQGSDKTVAGAKKCEKFVQKTFYFGTKTQQSSSLLLRNENHYITGTAVARDEDYEARPSNHAG